MSNDASMQGEGSIDPRVDADASDAEGAVPATDQIIEQGDRVEQSIAAEDGPARGTLRDVADSLGVSSAVALRALRGMGDIRPLLRDRVREAAERLNFPMEELAQEDDQRGVVAVLVNSMRNTWISDLVRAARIELAATGRTVVVVPTRRRVPEYPVAADLEVVESLVRLGVDGFLTVSDLSDMEQVLDATGDRPVVGIGCSRGFIGRFDTVRIDDEAGQGLLVDHLVSLGHREIAHAGGVGSAVAKERAEAFTAAMRRHGLEASARIEPADFTEQVGTTAGSMLLRGSQVPTAITCVNDVCAVGVLSAAREAGYEVPSQLAVGGYGNTSLAASGVAQITSIDPNSPRLGALAAQFLVERVSGHEEDARDVAVHPELVLRRSTSAGPRPEVQRRKRITVD